MRIKHDTIGRSLSLLLMLGAAMPALAKPPVRSTTAGVVSSPSDALSPYYRNISPFYRNISAFWGEVNPFYRNISAFWGDIDPFYRNISPFAGSVDPMYRNISPFWGSLDPMYRNISPFGGEIYPDYRNISPFWESTGQVWAGIDSAWGGAGSYAANPTGYVTVRDQLVQLSSTSEAMWGAAVKSQTGKSFDQGFATPLFAKYGIDLGDPKTLEGLSAAERSHFFLDWYDGLMSFAGTDHVDWWMKTANWTPAITQAQGSGKGTTIGLIDFFVAGDAGIQSKTVFTDGVSKFSNGHGAGVASLMVAAHDGKGVMGIAPNASIAAFNPFDASGTADWPDINRGIIKVTGAGASVVNLSLGVPGWTFHPDWKAVFADPGVAKVKDKTVYVIAAGNDGITQTQNINWIDKKLAGGLGGLLLGSVGKTVCGAVDDTVDGLLDVASARDTSFILVGSIDPTGTISEFSNRPGESCLLKADAKGCEVRFKDRFIVAPGELILVSDDAGGIVRRSGTSLAAPLVSGAIALLHDRWPWLKTYPRETTDIILGSAKDLGARGTDGVYGVGLLDVAASQSPLDFNKLTYYQVDGQARKSVSASQIKQAGVQTSWEASGLYYSAFEKIGRTQRDFLIPLSSRLVGLSAPSGERFQDYVYSRMVSWMQSGKFTDLNRQSAAVPNGLGLNLTMTAGTKNPEQLRYSRRDGASQSSLRLDAPSGRFGLTVGQGDGAIALGGQGGFGLFSDYDAGTGGVNPVLGFASGGGYAAMRVAATPSIGLSFGASERERSRRLDVLGVESATDIAAFAGLKPYRAKAAHLALDYRLSPAVTVQASYTRLAENAVLGIRSLEPEDIRGGSRSDATTIGADAALGGGLSLSASATLAKTRSVSDRAALTTAGGLLSSSYQMAVTKERVFGTADRVRVSLAQPLVVERGSFDFKSVQVVDRETGELGVVGQQIDAAGIGRRFVAEAIYGLSLMDGRAELSAFGRGQIGGEMQAEDARFTMGGRWSLSF